MEKFINIAVDPIKKKYELSFNEKTCSFELKIRKTIIDFIEQDFAKRLDEIFTAAAQNFGIPQKTSQPKEISWSWQLFS